LIVVAFIFGGRSTLKNEKMGRIVIKTIYHYLVLFSTLMMVIGGSISVFIATANIIFPEPYYQNFQEYRISTQQADPKQLNVSDATLRARYDEMVELARASQVARDKSSLIKSIGFILIPLPIFIYFQRRMAKNNEE
jgi:hypothetical protein